MEIHMVFLSLQRFYNSWVGLIDEVELKVEGNHLIVKAIDKTRKDWEERFKEMAKKGHDLLLDQAFNIKWDDEEWTW